MQVSPRRVLLSKRIHSVTLRPKALTSKGLCVAVLATLAGVHACSTDRIVNPPEAGFSLTIAGGNNQQVPAGSTVPQPLRVMVRGGDGAALAAGAVMSLRTGGRP